MKTVMFAVALAMGGAAFAQSEPMKTDKPEMFVPMSQTVAPDNSNPELDARGIPVISDPAVSPPGFNMPAGVGGPFVDASQAPAPQPATQSYPACTREITDHCVQTYERSHGRR